MIDGTIAIAYEQQPHMKTPTYGLFSGRLEKDEPPLAGIQRELLEESGIVSDTWELFQEYTYPGKIDWTVYTFLAKQGVQNRPVAQESGEKIETVFCTPEEFVMHACTPEFRSREISDYLYRLRAEGRLDEFYTLLS
jgi:8-oxo-dGTP pyrophosphatase MutT (NUDIX family)